MNFELFELGTTEGGLIPLSVKKLDLCYKFVRGFSSAKSFHYLSKINLLPRLEMLRGTFILRLSRK